MEPTSNIIGPEQDYTDTLVTGQTAPVKPTEIDPEYVHLHQSHALDVAAATWRTETAIGQALNLTDALSGVQTPQQDPSYNPYTDVNEHKEEFKDLLPLIDSGEFNLNSLDSPQLLRAYAKAARQNMKDRETIANGTLGGQVLGMGASMLDVTSLISLGGLATSGVKAATLAGRALTGAAMVGIDSAVQEGVLQSLDPVRPKEDAYYNIGTGVALGAALGPMMKFMHPDNPLHGADNPFARENVQKGVLVENRVGQLPEEGHQITNDPNQPHTGGFGADSIGAAAVSRETLGSIAADEADATTFAVGKSRLAKAIDWALATRWTPLGRLNGYTNSTVRDSLLKIYDHGGLLTGANLKGEGGGIDAETRKVIFDQRMVSVLHAMENSRVAANKELGQSGAGIAAKSMLSSVTQGAVDKNMVQSEVFNRAAMDFAVGHDVGSSIEDIRAGAMKRLTDSGLTNEQAAKVLPHIETAGNTAMDGMTDLMKRAVDRGLVDPEAITKGRNYVPQLWDRAAIDANPEDVKAMLMEVSRGAPDEQWLKDNGFIDAGRPLAEGEEALPKSWEELKASGDATKAAEAQRLWGGDVDEEARSAADARVRAAQKAQLQAQENMADILKEFKGADRDWRKAKLSEMKVAGRLQERGAYTRLIASASYRADKAQARIDEVLKRTGGVDPDQWHAELGQILQDNGIAVDQILADRNAAHKAASDGEALTAALRGQRDAHNEKLGAIKAERKDVLAERADMRENLGGTELARALTPNNQERAALNADRRATQAERQQTLNDLKEAIAEKQAAQEDLKAANAAMRRASQEQRETRSWFDAVGKEVEEMKKNEGEALLAPGLKQASEDTLAKLDALKAEFEKATAARRAAREARASSGLDKLEAERTTNLTARELRKAVYAQRKLDGAPAVEKWVDDFVNSYRGLDRSPRGFAFDELPDSGRIKERRFNFTAEQRQAFMDKGYLRNNLADAFSMYHQDIGGRLALHEALGGRKMDQIMKDAAQDYSERMGRAGSDKERSQLQKEWEVAQKDLQAAHDRVLGRYDPKDHNSLVWTADQLRMLGVNRFMGGFVFAAIGDIATAALQSPSSPLKILTAKGARDYAYIVKQAAKGDEGFRELERVMGSFEAGLFMQLSDRQMGRGTAADYIGIGTGRTKQITGAIEKGLETTATLGSKLTGLKAVSDNYRRTVALVELANIREWVGKWDTLGASKQARLAAVGIGEREAKALNGLFEKYGEEQNRGLFSPNMHKWLGDRNGEEMKDVLEAALIKSQKRASYAGGLGSQPLLMDKWYGKMFLQFQNMAFQFTDRFLRAGLQHGFVTGDHIRFAHAMGWALASGALMSVLAEFRKPNGDVTKMLDNPASLAYNVVQRSGILGFSNPYIDATEKLLDPTLKASFNTSLQGGATKYSANSWAAGFLGPWYSTFDTIQQSGADSANGKFSDAAAKAARLIPFNQQTQFVKHLVAMNGE
ncbi:hypothetical protein QCE62_00250 [Caballeronia sp. LZ033]|uniref:hypothetical protein n=1 Tax=Caballeronia sp. LZ033 TaxID=3038566 RepID=UPI00285ADC08|nr:hypothetical protein [Caballeronia sp. LZ033]MDR5812018.1 hypothetical protein [Caballeronia sp. LZ033]